MEVTVSTIQNCLDANCKLICVDANMRVHTYKKDTIVSLSKNEDTTNNELVINGEIQEVKFIVYSDCSLVKVDNIIEQPNDTITVSLYIHTGVKLSKTNSVTQDVVETIATSFILLLRLMCSCIANNKLRLHIHRYRRNEEIEIMKGSNKVFIIGTDLKPFEKNELKENDWYFINPDKVTNKALIKIIKRIMGLSNKVCASRVESVYNEYLTGKHVDKNFEIWASMYASIYKLEDPRRIMVPELIGTDENTRTIVRYLHRRYLISKFTKLGKPIPIELKVAFDEFKIVGSYAYKCGKYANEIKNNFIKSMTTVADVPINKNIPKLYSILDMGGILTTDDVKTLLRKYDFIVSITRCLVDDDSALITIYVHSPDMVAILSNHTIMNTIKDVSVVRQTTIEFKHIRTR